MRTTLDLPDPLFRRLKARAALEGLSLKDLIAEYVSAGLSRATPTFATHVSKSSADSATFVSAFAFSRIAVTEEQRTALCNGTPKCIVPMTELLGSTSLTTGIAAEARLNLRFKTGISGSAGEVLPSVLGSVKRRLRSRMRSSDRSPSNSPPSVAAAAVVRIEPIS